MFKHLGRAVLAASLVLTPALTALADVSGVFTMGQSDRMTIHYRDDETIRFELPDPQTGEQTAYLIVDGGTYAITGNEVIDMADMGAMIGGLAKGMMGDLMGEEQSAPDPADFTLEATGREVTVAGLPGELHRWSDGRSTGELVLSDEPGAVALTRAWMRLAERMVESMGMGDDPMMAEMARLQEHPDMKNLGILRSHSDGQPDERMELVEFSDKPLADRLFVLPAEPMKMPAMPLGGGGGMPDMNDPAVQQMMREMMQQMGR
ncbi:MAG: hypothetical protein ACP5DC_02640 [Halothiobacillaceae bacterium]